MGKRKRESGMEKIGLDKKRKKNARVLSPTAGCQAIATTFSKSSNTSLNLNHTMLNPNEAVFSPKDTLPQEHTELTQEALSLLTSAIARDLEPSSEAQGKVLQNVTRTQESKGYWTQSYLAYASKGLGMLTSTTGSTFSALGSVINGALGRKGAEEKTVANQEDVGNEGVTSTQTSYLSRTVNTVSSLGSWAGSYVASAAGATFSTAGSVINGALGRKGAEEKTVANQEDVGNEGVTSTQTSYLSRTVNTVSSLGSWAGGYVASAAGATRSRISGLTTGLTNTRGSLSPVKWFASETARLAGNAAQGISDMSDLVKELGTGVNRNILAIADALFSLRESLNSTKTAEIIEALELILKEATQLQRFHGVSCLIESTSSNNALVASRTSELLETMIANIRKRLDKARSEKIDSSSRYWDFDYILKELHFHDVARSFHCRNNVKDILNEVVGTMPELKKACSKAAGSANSVSEISANIKFWVSIVSPHILPAAVFLARSTIKTPSYAASGAFIAFQTIALAIMLGFVCKSASEVLKDNDGKKKGDFTPSQKANIGLLISGLLSLPFSTVLLVHYITEIGAIKSQTMQMKEISVYFVCSIIFGIALPALCKLYSDGYFTGLFKHPNKDSNPPTVVDKVETEKQFMQKPVCE